MRWAPLPIRAKSRREPSALAAAARPRLLVVVLGTATEVGKTWMSAAALRELAGRGRRVSARKPAQSFDPDDGHPTDAFVLGGATGENPRDRVPAGAVLVPGGPGATDGRLPAQAQGTGADVAEMVGRRGAVGGGVDVGLVETGRRAAVPARRRRRLRRPGRRPAGPTWSCWWPTAAWARSTRCGSAWPPLEPPTARRPEPLGPRRSPSTGATAAWLDRPTGSHVVGPRAGQPPRPTWRLTRSGSAGPDAYLDTGASAGEPTAPVTRH